MTAVTEGRGTVVAVKRGVGFVGPLNKVKLGRSKIPVAGLEERGRFVDVKEIRREISRVRSLLRSRVLNYCSHIFVERRDLMKLMLSVVYSNTVASRGGS